MATGTAAITVKQFQEMEFPPEKRVELVAGEVVELGNAKPVHEFIKAKIVQALVLYIGTSDIGLVFPEMMYRLGDDDARIPDISFRLKEHIPDPLPNEYFGAPDLAVEIVSSESALELFRRVEDHLSGGSRTVWVVYPDTRAVIIYQPGGYSHVMHETDTLTADLLPGFAVNVGSLFPKS